MLVVFPIGLWVFSLICEPLARVSPRRARGRRWLYTMIGGLIRALAAAVPALIDIAHDDQSHRRRAVCGECLATHEQSAHEAKIGGGSEQPLE
jgi:uncharacterized membrane protein